MAMRATVELRRLEENSAPWAASWPTMKSAPTTKPIATSSASTAKTLPTTTNMASRATYMAASRQK